MWLFNVAVSETKAVSTTVDVSVSQSRTQDIMDCSAGGLLKQHVGMLTSHNCVGRYVNAGHIFVGSLAVNCRDVTEPANIRIRRMRMRICRAIKITSYYSYCNST